MSWQSKFYRYLGLRKQQDEARTHLPILQAGWFKITSQALKKRVQSGYLNIFGRISSAGQVAVNRVQPALATVVAWFKLFWQATKEEWQCTWPQLMPDKLPAGRQARALLAIILFITFIPGTSYFLRRSAVLLPVAQPRPVSIRADETNLLARTVAAEAEDEPYPGKVAVVAVVLNRLENPAFPNTIPDIIFEPWAFESVANGHFWEVQLRTQDYAATRDALNGWDPSDGAFFFFNPDKATSAWIWTRPQVTQIGDHIFTR